MATITRRMVLGKAIAAIVAGGAVSTFDHLIAAAVGDKPPIKRDLDNEYYFKVICNANGKCKVCWYNKDRQLMYCEPA